MSSIEKKAIFIGKGFIQVGVLSGGVEYSSRVETPVSYTEETFIETLKQTLLQSGASRIILSEEFVYVTTLLFPPEVPVARERVRTTAEESIPEDLQETEWDFRAMQYVKHQEKEGVHIIQVAVIARDFSKKLEEGLVSGITRIESILPESYVVASVEKQDEDVKIVVKKDQEKVVIIALKQGAVLRTVIQENVVDVVAEFEKFLAFVERETLEKVKHGIISGWNNDELRLKIEEKGLLYSKKEYDVFRGVFLESISGQDKQVLNLNVFLGQKKKPWWRIFS